MIVTIVAACELCTPNRVHGRVIRSQYYAAMYKKESTEPAKKRVKLLKRSPVSELITDTDSDESETDGESAEEQRGCAEAETEQLLNDPEPSHGHYTAAYAAALVPYSSSSPSASEEEDDEQSWPDQQTLQQATTSRWTLPPWPRKSVVHTYTGGPRGMKNSEAPHINDGSSPLSVFLLYFTEIISLLLVETNRYYHNYTDSLKDGPSPLPDITEAEMFVFLALTIQMGHCLRDKLTDYWSRNEQLHTPFYGNMMQRDRYFHILRFLHFTDNRNAGDWAEKKFDRLWKMRNLFEILNATFSKFYNPSEYLAIDDVIVRFKGRVVFKQYIPRKHKRYGIKLYKLCDSTGYIYDMKVYLGKNEQLTSQHLTAPHAIVRELTRKVEGCGHKLYMDNFFSSPDLFDDLTKKKINCCGTVRPCTKGMPQDLRPKNMNLKRGDLKVRTRDDLTAILWRDKRDILMLTNMHNAPAEGNFCDEQGYALKPLIVEDYNRHMGYVDKGDRMANSYSISRRTYKWTKKLFFHLLNLAILNSYILFSSFGGKKFSHGDFRLALVRNMLAHAMQEGKIRRPIGRPCETATNIGRLECRGSKHWPTPSDTRVRCRVCSKRGVTRNVSVKCRKCGVGLCASRSCFEEYHTKAHF